MVIKMSKKINIRPTSSVYATYKRLSYQPWTAIAEFVDNSTQSFYDHKEVLLEQKYSQGLTITIDYIDDKINGDRLEICDNAFGMEWSDFQRAVILNRPPKNTNGRNEFGMGLKTAACWFGSVWSVESTQLGSKNKYFTEINIDELEKYKTEEIDVIEDIVSIRDHFTKIVIRKLNKRIVGSRTIGKVKDLLSNIYREDLRSGYVRIFYNGTLLHFREAPVYEENVGGHLIQWKKDISFFVEHEGNQLPVNGFIAIRLPGSVKDGGLTLLRRGRVIVGGSESNYRPVELFGDSNSYAWQRLYGELHMDTWPVTQAKDNFDWHNSGLEEAFINSLSTYTQDYRRKAENIRVRERIKSKDLLKDAIQGFSNSGVVESLEVEIVNREQSSEPFVVPYPTSDPSTVSSESSDLSASNLDTNSIIIDGGNQANYKFRYKDEEFVFHIIFDISDPSLDWLLVERNGNSEYTLSINMKHIFFKPLIEKKEFLPIMARMSIALVLAEIESMLTSHDGKIEPSAIRLKMNEILEKVRKGDD